MAASASISRTGRPRPHDSLDVSDYSSDDDASCTSESSLDEENDVNRRMTPNWCLYRDIIAARGFRLDTCKDVKLWYQEYWATQASEGRVVTKDLPGYLRACRGQDEDELCRDAGLPDRLFRGTHCSTGTKVVIKAVHLDSREYDVIRCLSCPSMRIKPMNHCIPVLDLIEVSRDDLAFIVMEEWASHFIAVQPSSLGDFFNALRQCIEHVVFMHTHHIAHLDISIRNILTNCKGQYAFIDYELSTRYDDIPSPRVRSCRRAEVPPELERGEPSDPYKVDIYALGMFIFQVMDITGYIVPDLYPLAKQMTRSRFEHRPTALQVLFAFDALISTIHSTKLPSVSNNPSHHT